MRGHERDVPFGGGAAAGQAFMPGPVGGPSGVNARTGTSDRSRASREECMDEQKDPSEDTQAKAETIRQAEQQFKREVRQAGGDPSPGIDFNTFIISLASSAMAHLEGGALPTGDQLEPDFQAAQQMIDILGLLE